MTPTPTQHIRTMYNDLAASRGPRRLRVPFKQQAAPKPRAADRVRVRQTATKGAHDARPLPARAAKSKKAAHTLKRMTGSTHQPKTTQRGVYATPTHGAVRLPNGTFRNHAQNTAIIVAIAVAMMTLGGVIALIIEL